MSFIPFGGKTVLVVDDDRRITELLARVLELKGYMVLTAHDGISALDILKRETVEMVVLDLGLPGISGAEVCRKIRNTEAIREIPIIMISGQASDADRVVGKVLGANHYLLKPFRLQEFLSKVESCLGG